MSRASLIQAFVNQPKIGAAYSPDKDKFNQTAVSASLGYAFNDAWRLDANFLQAKSYAEFDNAEPSPSNLLQDAWLNAQAGTRSLKLSGVVNPSLENPCERGTFT